MMRLKPMAAVRRADHGKDNGCDLRTVIVPARREGDSSQGKGQGENRVAEFSPCAQGDDSDPGAAGPCHGRATQGTDGVAAATKEAQGACVSIA